ncbi:DNA cytosine methyltransferase [Tepidibacillus infernus]|uniref:DNA cytosine methyltransferase n=1 Tax=Tepidibacillus infernus TaxID=1806172 RepID=UPI003A27F03E
MNIIDLFAGAGGLSEGFIRKGFKPIAHIEMDKYASMTLKTRMGYHYLREKNKLQIYYDYITGKMSREEFYSYIPEEINDTVLNIEISDSTINSIFEIIDQKLKESTGEEVDVIIGGPPCQAYSLVGRARDPYGKEHDPRNHLYKQYVKFLKRFKPKMFVFENVPGILSAGRGELFKDVQKYMSEANYEIEAKTLNSFDFGVLQQRKRVILIGWRKELNLEYPDFEKINHNNVMVKDILIDLPPLKPSEKIEYGEYLSPPTKYLEVSGIRGKSDVLTQHISRAHNDRDREIYRIAIEMWNKEKRRLKYTDLPDHLITHNNLESFLDRFKVVASNLPYSHTVVAHISKDGHYYIHPDIYQLRSLTVREVARIQSFPDNFYFEGPRTAIFTQIGNAVPPLMAEKIAQKIKKMLSSL